MNARELLAELEAMNPLTFDDDERERYSITHRAMSLLAAAEANDGTAPIVADVDRDRDYLMLRAVAIGLERERNGLAARVGELEKDAERYRWLRLRLEVRNQQAFSGSVRPGIAVRIGGSFFDTECRRPGMQKAEKLDAAIDAAIEAKP